MNGSKTEMLELKLCKGKKGVNLHDLVFGNGFFDIIPKVQVTKE